MLTHISLQYLDNVINNGTAQYANAYFELNYIRAFSLNTSNIYDGNGNPMVSTAPPPPFTTSAPQVAPPASTSLDPTGGVGSIINGALTLSPFGATICVTTIIASISWILL